ETGRVRMEELDNQLRRITTQRERTGQELETLSAGDVAAGIAEIEAAESGAGDEVDAPRRRMDELVAELQGQRVRERELAESADGARRDVHAIEGRIVSLEA